MTKRKKLEGALADWHPHPKSAPSSLIPVVRDAAPPVVRDAAARDELAESFFTSVPREYVPEPPLAPEPTTRRAVIDSAAVRARRKYLMRYVAGAVSMASLIGLAAVVRVTTAGDASAADRISRVPSALNSLLSEAASLPRLVGTQAATVTAAEGLPPAVIAEPVAPTAVPDTPAPPSPAAAEMAAMARRDQPAPNSNALAESAPSIVAPAVPPGGTTKTEATGSSTADAPSEPADRDPKAAAHAKRISQRALDRGHLREAIEAGEQSVSLDPTDADAWLILGGAYESRGAYSEARRCFKRCSRLAKRGGVGECRALLR